MSFGSILRGDGISDDVRRIFLSTFARLPQRVVWKWEDQEKLHNDVPSNVMLTPWMPQQDLLGHPKINAQKAHDGGYAIRLNWDELTEETLYGAIQIILSDPRYYVECE